MKCFQNRQDVYLAVLSTWVGERGCCSVRDGGITVERDGHTEVMNDGLPVTLLGKFTDKNLLPVLISLLFRRRRRRGEGEEEE